MDVAQGKDRVIGIRSSGGNEGVGNTAHAAEVMRMFVHIGHMAGQRRAAHHRNGANTYELTRVVRMLLMRRP